ncbi:MAG: SDR family NAD(P)-dependent oxidoreductase [Rhodobacteraceae bacterium]|nr:SDR family NAD(P)-dependent oxidoreductase [Paracoccaceae bacterium]
MAQKSILITGCSSGIGYDAAHTLHKRGWRVFASCRQAKDVNRLKSEGLESLVLDYADETSIKAAVAQVFTATNGALDALFNNGAYAIPAATEDLPRDALRAIFEVNLFGQFDLINQVLPTMKTAGNGRIVNCSSVLGIVALPMRGAYCATKFAMEAMTDALRYENAKSGVRFISIQPGPIATKIRENAIPHFEKWIDWEGSSQRQVYVEKLRPRLYEPKTSLDKFELMPDAVTKKLIHALESRSPKPRYKVTTPTYIAEAARRILSKRMLDRMFTGA